MENTFDDCARQIWVNFPLIGYPMKRINEEQLSNSELLFKSPDNFNLMNDCQYESTSTCLEP